MITQLEIRNFMAFEKLSLQFSPKINVIIGENATGKTNLLKAIYALSSGQDLWAKRVGAELPAFLTERFLRLFMPLDDTLGKLHHGGATQKALIRVTFATDQVFSLTLHNNSRKVAVQTPQVYKNYTHPSVLIPTKEMISFMRGFLSLYERYELSFDETYRDICVLLDLPEMRRDALPEKCQWAIETIEAQCGGRFIFQGAGKVIFRSKKGEEYSANAVAEGFRKFGILSRLLETGAIQPGMSGPLLWDEPEANINPKLVELLVGILLELSRNGQQVILATHDYFFLKWFDLLADKRQGDEVLFHSLYRDPLTQGISVKSTREYLRVSPNPIADTFSDITDHEVAGVAALLRGTD